jgi:outer membrane lipoprotein-sorting protein
MRNTIVFAAFLIGLGLATAYAAEPAAPAAEPEAALPPAVAALLDALDAAGKNIKTLTAKFDYVLNQVNLDDVTKRKGEITFKMPNLVKLVFTVKPETFIFDGRIMFHLTPATKQLDIVELRLPNEPPIESLELGKTPFPIPFGQKKENVLKFFTVSSDTTDKNADKKVRPADLELVPKKGTPLARTYTRILLWIDAKTSLPTRVKLFDTSENETAVDFHDIELNKDVDNKTFARPDVPQSWEIITHGKE